MIEFNQIFDSLEQLGFDYVGPRSNALIQKAEIEIGFPLPGHYRKFISRFGCGDLGGAEIFGLISDNFHSASIPDAVWATLRARESGLENEFLVISEGGYGGLVVLCLFSFREYELGAIYEVPTGSKDYTMMYNSFLEFIQDFINKNSDQ